VGGGNAVAREKDRVLSETVNSGKGGEERIFIGVGGKMGNVGPIVFGIVEGAKQWN